MVARRMAEERPLAVITSNSSHSVQKSCCVIATSSSTMRTFGFVIIFFPVYYQDGPGDALRSHLRPSSFRRMPRFKTFTARTYSNAGANGARAALNQKKRRKRGIVPSQEILDVN